MSVFGILSSYWQTLLGGLWVTLELFLAASIIGIVLGGIIGVLGARHKPFGTIVKVFSFVVVSIPILVLVFWFYYPFQSLLGISLDPFTTAVIALGLVNVAAIADLIKNTMDDFPQQYIVAGRVCGMSEASIVRKIEFPIIFRQIIPSLLTTQVYILQATLFASLISVSEIFRVTQNINAVIYKPVEIFSSLALFFLIICLPLNGLAYYLKKKYTRSFSEQ